MIEPIINVRYIAIVPFHPLFMASILLLPIIVLDIGANKIVISVVSCS